MALLLQNNGAGGSSGTTVTAGSGGNSGGASGNFWDSVVIGASEADTFDSTWQVNPGDLAYKITSAATVAANYLAWTTSLGTLAVGQTLSGRFYYVPPSSTVATTIRVMHILNGTTVLCGIGHTNTVANIQCRASGDVAAGPTTGGALTIGTLYRIEFIFTQIGSATLGGMTINVFPGNSTTPVTGYPITASGLNFGTLAPNAFRVGICTAAGLASLSYFYGAVQLDDTGVLPGPELPAATSSPRRSRALVLQRGVRDLSAMRRYARTPPLFVTFADVATGALIFGGTTQESWDWAFPRQQHLRRLPLARGLRDPAGMRRYARVPITLPLAGITFTDVATGAWIFAGARVEAKRGTDTRSGTWIFAGSRVEAKRNTDTSTGSLIFGGSRVELKRYGDARSGSLIFGGTRVEATTFRQTPTGAWIFGGSATEHWQRGSGTPTVRARVTFIIPDARGRRRRTRW